MLIGVNLKAIIQMALKEDIGPGDITTSSVLPRAKKGKFVMIVRQDCIICGLSLAETVFETVDADIRFKPAVNEGARVSAGKAIAYAEGSCATILSAERTALNFLGWLSGISTLTNRFVEAVKGTRVKIMDTRKTIPALRRFQKYAVRVGGGTNHRMGLYDHVLIKDNHISSIMFEPTITKSKSSAIELLLKNARQNAPKSKKIEIEVTDLDMLKIALEYNPDIVMLDNMSIDDIREAVRIRDAHRIKVGDVGLKVLIEVSGGVTLQNVREIAEAGVDMISIGALTHSAPSIDICLEPR